MGAEPANKQGASRARDALLAKDTSRAGMRSKNNFQKDVKPRLTQMVYNRILLSVATKSYERSDRCGRQSR